MINFINSLYSFQLWPLPSLAPEKLFLLLCPLLQFSLYALALKHHLLCHCLPKVSTYSRCFLHKPTVLCMYCFTVYCCIVLLILRLFLLPYFSFRDFPMLFFLLSTVHTIFNILPFCFASSFISRIPKMFGPHRSLTV